MPAAGGTPVAAPGGTWGTAREVAGALNNGGNAGVVSVSCRSAGNCSAGGFYNDRSGSQHAFVVDEKSGTWGAVHEVAGRLNSGGSARVNSVSCASAGNCSAGGSYAVRFAIGDQAFVVSEKNGTWGAAQEVAGRLNSGGSARVDSVSCASAGNCSAGGTYLDRSNHQQAFVVSEKNGTWGTAEEVPGTAALNSGGDAEVNSVSCASAGNCGAGGYYNQKSGTRVKQQAFVVNEQRGAWGKAREVAGVLNAGGGAEVDSVSCASAGNCSAGGFYGVGSSKKQAFIVSEKNGTWRGAQGVAVRLNAFGNAQVNSVSCASAGNCSAAGFYSDRSGSQHAFVVSEKNGKLGAVQEVAGKLNIGLGAQAESVSCASAGNCSAGGFYADRSGNQQAFVVSEKDGTWGTAEEVPGTAALNSGGNAEVDSVSCASAGNCGAGGDYTPKFSGPFGNPQAFVVNES